MINAEAIKQMIDNMDEYGMITDYIACPYTHNPDCKYDGGNNHDCCDDCKMEWLHKEWEN